jgi:hypothetical protein
MDESKIHPTDTWNFTRGDVWCVALTARAWGLPGGSERSMHGSVEHTLVSGANTCA